jgi:DNA polymerase-3 subunit delta'
MARKPKVALSPEPEPGSAQQAASIREVPTLDDLLGQDHAVALLRAALSSGRIHHAWVFHGPVGVGKFTAAMAFAAMLLDPTTAPDLSGKLAPDPDSQVQHLIRTNSHPDLHIVTKELAAISSDPEIRDRKQRVIPVQVVREFLIEPAQRTRSVLGKSLASKVFIVDEAELLAPAGQDAMLKTLEEPPEGTVIILVTPSEERLLPTVRSRSQRVAFTPLDDKAMREWYRRAGLPEDPPERRDWVLRFAGGSPGWAASAIEHDLYAWEQTLAPALASLDRGTPVPELGAALYALVEEKAAAAVKSNPDASKEAANIYWARRLLSYLAERYRLAHRDALLRAGGPAPASVSAPFLRATEALAAAENHAAANVNLNIVMENLAAQLAMRLARPAAARAR